MQHPSITKPSTPDKAVCAAGMSAAGGCCPPPTIAALQLQTPLLTQWPKNKLSGCSNPE